MLVDIFPTTIFVHHVPPDRFDNVQTEISKQIPKLRKLITTPWSDKMPTTFNYNLVNNIKDFDLNLLEQEILKCVTAYSNGLNLNANYYIKESWFNFGKKNTFQFEHAHSNSLISGVYYYNTNTQDGKIEFRHPNPIAAATQGFPYKSVMTGNFPARIATTFNFAPEPGKLILFPGWLTHRVLPNTTNNERISISFNLDSF